MNAVQASELPSEFVASVNSGTHSILCSVLFKEEVHI